MTKTDACRIQRDLSDRRPPKPPQGDEEIPGRDREKKRDPDPRPPGPKEPEKPKKERLPPDPDQPQAPVKAPVMAQWLVILLCLLFQLAFSSRGMAQEEGGGADPNWGLQYGYGHGKFTGDFTTDENSAFHDLQLTVLHQTSQSWPIRAYLALDLFSMSARHTGSPFPFPSGEELKLLGFFFIPTICTGAAARLEFCFGIGQGTLNVNTDQHQRDYGTWNYQVMTKYQLSRNWRAILLWKYAGKVEQKVAGVDSAFALHGFALAAEWLAF